MGPMSRTPARAFLLDPRLIVGLLLVAGSVAGVVAIVSAADESVEVLVASSALSPGDRVNAVDLETRRVRLDAATELYLAPGDVPAEGVVVARSVSAGELVPVDAVGSVEGVRLASLVLSVEGGLAASIAPGSVVDVWAAHEGESGDFAEPAVIVTGAIVVRLVETSTIVSGGEVTGIEVLVPRTRIAAVLEAVANEASMSIVAATLPIGG